MINYIAREERQGKEEGVKAKGKRRGEEEEERKSSDTETVSRTPSQAEGHGSDDEELVDALETIQLELHSCTKEELVPLVILHTIYDFLIEEREE